MSLLRFLGLGSRESSRPEEGSDTATVRRIVGELEALDPNEARHLAAFAYILTRVANVDFDISEEETRVMEQVIEQIGKLPSAQAVLIVEIAKNQNRLLAGTEDFLVTRQFRDTSTPEQRQRLLNCLFAVAAADDKICSAEDAQLSRIASELDIDHKTFVATRMKYSDKREVLKFFRP